MYKVKIINLLLIFNYKNIKKYKIILKSTTAITVVNTKILYRKYILIYYIENIYYFISYKI